MQQVIDEVEADDEVARDTGLPFEVVRAVTPFQKVTARLEREPAPEVPLEPKNPRTEEQKKKTLLGAAPTLPVEGTSREEAAEEIPIPAGRSRLAKFATSRGTQNTGVMHDLLAAYERGELEPEPIELPPLPKYLGKNARAVAEDLRLLFGLKRARCDEYPVPYSANFGANRLGITRDDVKRARAQLVRAGVVEESGELPKRNGVKYEHGTKLYRLPRGV